METTKSVGGFPIVAREHVFAEISGEIAPDSMDMVGVVLRVVVLEQEGRSLHAIIVRLSGRIGSGPGKMDVVETGLVDRAEISIAHLVTASPHVLLDKAPEEFLLGSAHLRGGQSRR